MLNEGLYCDCGVCTAFFGLPRFGLIDSLDSVIISDDVSNEVTESSLSLIAWGIKNLEKWIDIMLGLGLKIGLVSVRVAFLEPKAIDNGGAFIMVS